MFYSFLKDFPASSAKWERFGAEEPLKSHDMLLHSISHQATSVPWGVCSEFRLQLLNACPLKLLPQEIGVCLKDLEPAYF